MDVDLPDAGLSDETARYYERLAAWGMWMMKMTPYTATPLFDLMTGFKA